MSANRFKIVISVFIIIAMIGSVYNSQNVYAGTDLKTVKMAYPYEKNYFEGASENATKSGYGYEYMKTVAGYAGWNLQYVYGSYDELIREFAEGYIDLFPGVCQNSANSEMMNCSNYSIWGCRYALFVNSIDIVRTSDYSPLSETGIGVVKSMEEYCKKWISELGIEAEPVLFANREEMSNAFRSGEIVAYFDDTVFMNEKTILARAMEEVPMYIGVTKAKPELESELANAVSNMLRTKSGYVDILKAKYFTVSVPILSLTEDEQAWMKQNSRLRIGTLDNFLPYSDCNEISGNVDGLIDVFMKEMIVKLGLEKLRVEYVYFNTYQDMMNALKEDMVDAIFPAVEYLDVSEKEDYLVTDSVIDTNLNMVFKGKYSDSMLQKIAVTGSMYSPYYVAHEYPDSEMVKCETRKECMDAVINGDAGCAVVDRFNASQLLSEGSDYIELRYLLLPESMGLCFAVNQNSPAVFSLLNKGVSNVSKDSIRSEVAKLTAEGTGYSSEKLFLTTHSKAIMLQVLIIGLTVFAAVALAIVGSRNMKVNEKLKKANDEIKQEGITANVRNLVISTLSDKYDLVCYVDQFANSIKLYRSQGAFAEYLDPSEEEISPSKFDYTLNKLIAPEDISLFRDSTDRNMVLNILKKQNSYYVTCRLLIDSEERYYRCNFAIDKTDEKGIVIGFANVDADMRRETELQNDNEQRNSIIKHCSETMFNNIESGNAIDRMLKLLTEYYCADRAYICEQNRDRSYINMRYEYCTFGVESLRLKRQQMPFEYFNNWFNVFETEGGFYISSPDEDMDVNDPKYTFFKEEAINNSLIFPLQLDGKIIGLVGVANLKNHIGDRFVLQAVSTFLHSEILRRKQTDIEHRILDCLVESYLAVFFVNLRTGFMSIYALNDAFREKYGHFEDYRLIVESYVSSEIAPQYREHLRNTAKPENILEQLKDKDSFVISYVDDMGIMPVFIEAQYLKANPEGTTAVLCILNRTEQVHKELQSKQELKDAISQAEAANRAKSSFLSKMSHDIRTPINGVMGMTEIALKHMDDTERVEDCLQKIDQASHHLLSLVNDVLDMSRIESGKTEINLKPVNMNDFCENCITIVAMQMAEKGINLVRELSEFRHPDVFADELHLRQVLINILGNALKFTPNGGMVFFRVKETESNAARVNYHFEIEDTGIGMKKEFVEHIFEEFSQEDEETHTNYKGTGLGMAIARQLVEMMGGNIGVQSELNIGTTFTVDIGFEIDSHPVVKEVRAEAGNINGAKVLLVEDNELNLEITSELLETEGVEVTAVDDGYKAIEMFERSEIGEFDVILMDVMMPVMDGLEATRNIRKQDRPDAATIPIIAMTANAFDEDIRKAMEAGMNAHLSKPVKTDVMLRTIAGYLRK